MTDTTTESDTREFIGAETVAQLLGYPDRRSFYVRRTHLRAIGFPDPVPFHLRPQKWRRSAVLAWIEEAELAAQNGETLRVSGDDRNDAAFDRRRA